MKTPLGLPDFNQVIDTYTQDLLIFIMATTSVPHSNSLRGYTEQLKTNTLGLSPLEFLWNSKETYFHGPLACF